MRVERLSHEIARISGIPKELSARIIASLTFGVGTSTPDPALQPLVPIGEEELAIPGIFILSSNWPRNMLALHARVSPETFDANSAIFEKRMIAALEDRLPHHFERRANVRIPTSNASEEIDLVLIDPQSCTILICELRWMIQPGDAREVLNRKRAVRQKVSQARRKLHRVRASMPDATRSLGLKSSLNWTIYGVVVIEGFGGASSEHPKEIPVVPVDIFVMMLCNVPRLDYAHAVLSSPLWLPQEGVDYEREYDTSTLCGARFKKSRIGIGGQSYLQQSLPLYVENALGYEISYLHSLAW